MSKAISYYDWELHFKKKDRLEVVSPIRKKENINSLGISEDEFKQIMKNWKQKNQF
jgi:hypothetical protein